MRDYHNASLEELLVWYAKSDAEAFRNFYQRAAPILFQLLLAKCGQVALAEDALQEAFLRIHKYTRSFDPNQSALAWSTKIAQNCLVDLYHKPNLSSTNLTSEPASRASDPSIVASARDELQHLLKSLTPAERQLFTARFLEGKSFLELADRQSTTAANIRQKVSRMVRRLREV